MTMVAPPCLTRNVASASAWLPVTLTESTLMSSAERLMPRSLRTWFSTAWRTRSASLPGTNTAELGADACGALAELAFGAAEETATGSLDLLQPKPARVARIAGTTQRRFIWFLLESSQIAIALSTRRTCQSGFQPSAHRLLAFFACFRCYVVHT